MAAMAVVLWAGYAVVSGKGGGDASPAGEQFKPVAPLICLMYAQDLHFERLNSFLADETQKDRAEKIRNEALVLAELANVNRLHKNKPDYRQWAEDVRGAALDLAAAAASGDFGKAKELSKRINTTCTACHKQYQ
jgi:hypothetical protein